MSAESFLAEANDLFVDEDFESALEKFNQAIALSSSDGNYFTKRSACLFKLSRFSEALQDATKAVELSPDDSAAYTRQGMAAFSLDSFQVALAAFTKANDIKSSAQLKTWIRKCEAELDSEHASSNARGMPPLCAPQQSVSRLSPHLSPTIAPPPLEAIPSEKPQAVAAAHNQPPAPKFKHDFFQTSTHITVSIFAKGIQRDALKVSIQKQELEVMINLGADKDYVLDLELCGEVIPSESRYDILSTKIEIKMKKANSAQWPTLENTGQSVKDWNVVQDGPSSGLTYPSSSKRHVNWDKMAVEDDKLEGEAALNSVFQNIYKNADDDQRRAMMKSFQESGGTVLSTNWNEVGTGEVKGSPPQGLEMKQWKDLHH